MSKKMFSTEDAETKTNERINDKYHNCILIKCLSRKVQLPYVSSDLMNQGGVHSDNKENVDTCYQLSFNLVAEN